MCEYLHLSPKVHAPLLNALQRSAPDSRAAFFSFASARLDFPVLFLSTPPSPRLPASALSSSTTAALSSRGGTGRRNSVFTAAEPFAMSSSAVGGTHGSPSGPVYSVDICLRFVGFRLSTARRGSRLRCVYRGRCVEDAAEGLTRLYSSMTQARFSRSRGLSVSPVRASEWRRHNRRSRENSGNRTGISALSRLS